MSRRPVVAAAGAAAAAPGSGGVPSPCVGLCALDAPGQHCLGCGRTLDEIAAWPRASDAWRAQCLERLAVRGLPSPPGAEAGPGL